MTSPRLGWLIEAGQDTDNCNRSNYPYNQQRLELAALRLSGRINHVLQLGNGHAVTIWTSHQPRINTVVLALLGAPRTGQVLPQSDDSYAPLFTKPANTLMVIGIITYA